MIHPVIGITIGDPGGVGPEVIAKTFHTLKLRKSPFYYLLIGSPEPFIRLGEKALIKNRINPVSPFQSSPLKRGMLNFLDISSDAKAILNKITPSARWGQGYVPGRVASLNGAIAMAALDSAAKLALSGIIDGIVTAPINKTAMRILEPKFHGHTEFLANAAGCEKYAMMFVSERLKVTLVSIHIPISKVSRYVNRHRVLEKIQLTNDFLFKYFKIKKPALAVCALNPHGKETGPEDEKEIRPAVNQARRQGINAVGPLSADQLFFDAYHGRFDAVISMYHDQGLAPFKMIAFHDGVNVTLGLPFIRTSPDHGTAFDIAYKNKADNRSFSSALSLAEKLLSSRYK